MVGKDERAQSQQSISLCAFTDWVPICFCSVGGTQGGVVSEATWSGISSAPDNNNQSPCALLPIEFRFDFAQCRGSKGRCYGNDAVRNRKRA